MPAAAQPTRLAELAAALGREVVGDGDFLVAGVASLEDAEHGDLSFVRSSQWLTAAHASKAGALVLPADASAGGRPAILSPHPGLDFARAVERLMRPPPPPPGVHASAVVDPGARVHAEACVGPRCVVGRGATVGRGTVLHANVTLYDEVAVGEDCVIHSGVVVCAATEIGDRVILQPGVVLGGDGFGYVLDEASHYQKVPHVGRVVLEDDVEVGANTTIDRASLAETRVRRGAKIDNLVQIAHSCEIGEDAIVVAQTGLSGSTVVGRGAMVMAQVGSAGHLRIGDGAFVGARTGLHKDVAAGGRVWGTPQLEERAWHKAMAALARLPDALRRLRAVERRLSGATSDEASKDS